MQRIAAFIAAAVPVCALAIVNVNTAQQSDLQRTKGLDKHKAKAIIEYRAQNGPIDDLAELGKIPGFTKDILETVKPEVAFSGDAYVPPPKAEKPKPKTK